MQLRSRSGPRVTVILAARGSTDAAVELATEAVRILRRTDLLSLRAGGYVDLGTALRAHGDMQGSMHAEDQARALYELKGDRVGAQRVPPVTARL